MKCAVLALAVVTIALGVGATGAGAAATVSAQVDPVATVTSSVTVIFDFDLYNCPPGGEILVEWEAREPDRADSGAVGAQPFGLSNGDPVQHLTLMANSSSFLAGELWVGSGFVTCGAIVIPVEGSGQAKSATGL